MIDSETGLPYDWSNPGGGAASTQPAYGQIPGGNQAASTQPAYGVTPPGINPQLPAGLSGTAIGQPLPAGLGSTAIGQQPGVASVGANGAVLPQIAQLLQQQGGVSPLLMALMGGGQGGGMHPLLMRYLMGQQQPQQPQFGPPTPNQQSWMTQMGWGNDLNALTPMQRGGLNTALGTTNGPDALANAQYNTPQDFVSQWRQMFGST